LLGSTFAGDSIWRRLPADSRAEFERRLEAAAGDIESMSNEEASRQVRIRVVAGMPRLDDTVLVRRLTLQTVALGRVDDATCGQFAQASFAGQPQPEAIAIKLTDVLTEAELGEWFNVAVLALEADARKSPAARSVPEPDASAVFERLLGSLDSTALQQIQTGATSTASAAEACVGARAMYNAIERLPDPDRRLIALADVGL
jgi:hypothetical protein